MTAEDRALDATRCRRCGGTGALPWREVFDDGTAFGPTHHDPCRHCLGTGTEPMSVAEIISAGIRVQRGQR